MKKILFGLIVVSMLAACVPQKTMGDIYLLISPRTGDKERHTLLRVSPFCFLKEVECPTPEIVTAFPKDYLPPYGFAPLFWSPNGRYLFFINHIFNYPQSTTYELFSYDAQTEEVQKIISGYEWINDLAWDPTSKWAVVTLTNIDNKDVSMFLITPSSGITVLPVESSNESGDISPYYLNHLRWKNKNEILFTREKLDGQSRIPKIYLFTFNIITGIETEVQLPSIEKPFFLSPDGDAAFLLFPIDNKVSTYDFKTQKITELKGFQSEQPVDWSPNSKWILACSENNETYVVTPDLAETKKIADECTFYYRWMPDSNHIILLFYSLVENSTEVYDSHWYVASIYENTVREIVIPNLDLKKNYIKGIYVQPMRP